MFLERYVVVSLSVMDCLYLRDPLQPVRKKKPKKTERPSFCRACPNLRKRLWLDCCVMLLMTVCLSLLWQRSFFNVIRTAPLRSYVEELSASSRWTSTGRRESQSTSQTPWKGPVNDSLSSRPPGRWKP